MVNKIALEFAQYVLQQNPKAKSFVAMYDAMSRAAIFRSFRNLGPEELARLGISFSLLATDKLEHIIEEARKALASHIDEHIKEVEQITAYGRKKHEAMPLVPRHEVGNLARQPNGVSPSPLTIHVRETIHH